MLSLLTWRRFLKNSLLLAFIDNDTAKDALVKGDSPTSAMGALSAQFWREAMAVRVVPWFERVASKSNVIDRVSRPHQYAKLQKDDRGVDVVWDVPVFHRSWSVPQWLARSQ